MKKTHKKIENNLRIALTHACEHLKEITEHFCWLTHDVNYNAFPKSLTVSCYFTDKQALQSVTDSELNDVVRTTIKQQLAVIDIATFDQNKQIEFLNENENEN